MTLTLIDIDIVDFKIEFILVGSTPPFQNRCYISETGPLPHNIQDNHISMLCIINLFDVLTGNTAIYTNVRSFLHSLPKY